MASLKTKTIITVQVLFYTDFNMVITVLIQHVRLE
jgi:hypothetical protein